MVSLKQFIAAFDDSLRLRIAGFYVNVLVVGTVGTVLLRFGVRPLTVAVFMFVVVPLLTYISYACVVFSARRLFEPIEPATISAKIPESAADTQGFAPRHSMIIPVHNEAIAVQAFYEHLVGVMAKVQAPFEMVFVDAGSRDATPALLSDLATRDPRVRFVSIKRMVPAENALSIGFDYSRGKNVFAMYADEEVNSEQITVLANKLSLGFDVASSMVGGQHSSIWEKGLRAYRRESLDKTRAFNGGALFLPEVERMLKWRTTEVRFENVGHGIRSSPSRAKFQFFALSLLESFLLRFLMPGFFWRKTNKLERSAKLSI